MGERYESSGSPRAARTAGAGRSRHRDVNPQVRSLYWLPACHDPGAAAGREMRERAALAAGLEAIGEAFGPAASIVLGRAETTCTHCLRPSRNRMDGVKVILLATLGR
jgi:hypothetical protein